MTVSTDTPSLASPAPAEGPDWDTWSPPSPQQGPPTPLPRRRTLVRVLAHAAGLTPALLIVWDIATGGLSYDPVRELTQRTGKDAFVFLVLSLAVSPTVALTGLRALTPLSRIFGLYAFGYAGLHLLAFVGLDFGFRPDLIVGGVLEKRFAVIGLAAFLILTALAATSTRGWMRRLGPLWRRIHRLAYAAGALASLHYLLAVKTITQEQWIWVAIVGGLLVLRLPEAAGLLAGIRRRVGGTSRP